MNFVSPALGLLLGSVGMVFPTAASAQGSSSPQQTGTPPASDQAQPAKLPRISEAARKEIVALQTAVNAKDKAAIASALAAAQAKAKTKEDRYFIAKLQLKAAVDANDNGAMAQGIEAVLASGYDVSSESAALYRNLGKLYYDLKSYDRSTTALERLLQLQPNDVDAMMTLAEARQAQGKTADAVATIQKAIAARTAAGQKAEEALYKRAVALSYNAKLPTVAQLTREWVTAYPTPKNWRDTIGIFQKSTGKDDASLIDSMRLAAATGALTSESDYYRFTQALLMKGFPGEAKTVLEQGFAANAIGKSGGTFADLYSQASTRAQGDQASLAASAKAALAAPDARKAMVTADAYYGYGKYTEAAELYRAALGKSGVDKDLANLRLGMALARAGDKAGATTALNAAGGAQADVARLWLIYLATKA